MGANSTETRNCITLKGSAQMVSDFFFYGINNILYQRGIYSPESFTLKQQYGLTAFVTTVDGVITYLNNVISQIKDWLEEDLIEQLVVVISNIDTKEPIERWEFKINCEKGFESDDKDRSTKTSEKDVKEIKSEMAALMRQITACVTFLPLLDCACSFNLLVYTKKDCKVPEKWKEDSFCYLPNAESVKLRSFSTSVHKVDSCVSYKVT